MDLASNSVVGDTNTTAYGTQADVASSRGTGVVVSSGGFNL